MTQKTTMSTGSSEPNQGRTNAATGELANNMKQFAGSAAEQAKKMAEGQITTRKNRAVETLGSVAHALRSTGEHLDSQSDSEVIQYVTRAADGVERVSAYLKNRNLNEVVHDVEGFARREPAIFFGAAFVAGLIGSRFLKSSRSSQARSSGRTWENAAHGSPGGGPYGSGQRAERSMYAHANGDETGRATLPTGASSMSTGASETGARRAGFPGSGTSGTSGTSGSTPTTSGGSGTRSPSGSGGAQGGTSGKA